MENIVEKETYNALQEKPYQVILGGKKLSFYPLSLEDREEMSVYASTLPTIDMGSIKDENVIAEAISCGKYAKEMASFISAASRQKSILPSLWLRNWHRRKKKDYVYKLALHEASSGEVYNAFREILKHIHPAFFLDIIITLKGTSILKPTKETSLTAPGQ